MRTTPTLRLNTNTGSRVSSSITALTLIPSMVSETTASVSTKMTMSWSTQMFTVAQLSTLSNMDTMLTTFSTSPQVSLSTHTPCITQTSISSTHTAPHKTTTTQSLRPSVSSRTRASREPAHSRPSPQRPIRDQLPSSGMLRRRLQFKESHSSVANSRASS